MRVVMMNPRLRCVVRRRHSTLLVLEEFGQQIELLFTSLGALEQLETSVAESLSQALVADAGFEWWNPRIPDARRKRPDPVLDLLREEELIETPEFVRRQNVAVRRVQGPVAGGQNPQKPK